MRDEYNKTPESTDVEQLVEYTSFIVFKGTYLEVERGLAHNA
jgi:hypothetical protein